MQKSRLLRGLPTSTVFAQGALGGGGYVTDIRISPDGLTKLANTDVYGAYIFNSNTNKWDNLITHERVPAAFNAKRAMGTYSMAVAPTLSSRIYVLAYCHPGLVTGLWRSDDRGKTFTDTRHKCTGAGYTQRTQGPKILVDPNNPDVLYWGNSAGLIYRSLDGGATIYDSGTFNAALATGIVSGTTSASNTTTLKFTPVPAALRGYTTANFNTNVCAYNATTPSSVGNDSAASPEVARITDTEVQLANNVTSKAGDLIYFGAGPVICFDPTSGTTTLSGVTVTKDIYIGWAWGGSAVWHSRDGGATFSPMDTGPTSVGRMVCSNDGVIYACDNRPTGVGKINLHNFWRYVTPTSTNTARLRTGWTNITAITNAPGNSFHAAAPDPNNPGHVATALDSGNINFSADYGQTWNNSQGGFGNTRTFTNSDCPWLINTVAGSLGCGNICFDPLVSNKLWLTSGIGIYYTLAPDQTTKTGAVFSCQTLDNNELIVSQILKVPNGGPICLAVEDRQLMVCPSPTVGPIDNLPYQAVFNGFIDDGSGDAVWHSIGGARQHSDRHFDCPRSDSKKLQRQHYRNWRRK